MKSPQKQIPKNLSWEVWASIFFTVATLGLSVFITIKLLLQKGDSVDLLALINFSIFNLLETFLSLKLILNKIRKEYNNALRISGLESYLILRGIIPKEWVEQLNPIYKNLFDD